MNTTITTPTRCHERARRELSFLAAAAGAALLALGATGCEAPPDEEGAAPSGVERTGQPVQLDSGILRGPFGGNGRIDEKHCPFPFRCTRRVGWASRFDLQARGRLRELRIWSGQYIDSIEMLWQSESNPRELIRSPRVGGPGGGLSSLLLEPDEAIVHVRVNAGKYVDGLTVRTDKGREHRWGGGGGGAVTVDMEGDELHGLAGLADSGGFIHQISFWTYLP